MPGGQDVRVLDVPAPTRARGAVRDWLIVSTVPERAYSEAAIEDGLQQLEWVAPRALAHEAVVEHFLSASAVLPMQLFTMFTGDDRALEHVVRDKRRITAILKRIEHKLEWGLRVSWNPDTPTAESGARPRKAASSTKRSAPTTGADYLVRKGMPFRDAHEAVARAVREAERAGCGLADLPLPVLRQFAPQIGRASCRERVCDSV